jgi:nucleotide-binding universal stress UspA family protein
MYQRILVAVDGSASSQRALDEAIGMARTGRGKVSAVYVLDQSVSFTYAGEYDPRAYLAALRGEGERVLDDTRRRFAAAGIDGEARLLDTASPGEDVATCLQHEAQRWPADLVVMGTHGRRGIRRLVLGSVAERFLRFSTCPVLLVREEAPAVEPV